MVVVAILTGLCGFLWYYCQKMLKTINVFLENGKISDAKELLFSHIEKTKEMDGQLKLAFEQIASLQEIAKISLQKIGVVRFNPFGDMGGNQSFSIALLDAQNNGFVLVSLFSKEGNRMYAKAILSGKSEHELSAEEKEAVNRATGSEITNPKPQINPNN